MSAIPQSQTEKDRSCTLQVLEGCKPEDYRLSRLERLPTLRTQQSPYDSTSDLSSTDSVWSGVPSRHSSAYSRATSVTPSFRSEWAQKGVATSSYLYSKPLPELPTDESPSASPIVPATQLNAPKSHSALLLSSSNNKVQGDGLSVDLGAVPLISPALSNFTASSDSSYASRLAKNPDDSLREHIRLFHPTSQNNHITWATIDTGSDCCCIRQDILESLGISLDSGFIKATAFRSTDVNGNTWQPLGRIELRWLPFRGDAVGAHETWFFVGDERLPHPVLLGKDFLFPRHGPKRIIATLVNVMNKSSKAERNAQKEAEKRHRKLVLENEKAKEARMEMVREVKHSSCCSSCAGSAKSTSTTRKI